MPKQIMSRKGQNEDASLVLRWGKEDSTALVGVEFTKRFTFNSESDKLKDENSFNSLWFELKTREEFNQLIRTLRKMRDSVLGKDA